MYIRQQQKRNFANKTVASAYPCEKARYRKNGPWRARECWTWRCNRYFTTDNKYDLSLLRLLLKRLEINSSTQCFHKTVQEITNISRKKIINTFNTNRNDHNMVRQPGELAIIPYINISTTKKYVAYNCMKRYIIILRLNCWKLLRFNSHMIE